MKTYVFIFILIVSLPACRKEAAVPSETSTATINILTPVDAATINRNDTVTITATATNTQSFHGYEVIVHPANDTTAVFRSIKHTHALTLNIQEKWVNTVPSASNMVVEVKVTLDHDGNRISKSRMFRCH